MHRALVAFTLAVALAACGTPRPAATPATPVAAAPAPATAAVGTLRVDLVVLSDGGLLHVALYDSPQTFPSEPAQTVTATTTGGRGSVTFDGLAPGRYAVTVFQDVDGNGEIGMGSRGPTEPWGFSNDDGAQLMGPPEFTPSSVEVGTATPTVITLPLRRGIF